MELPKFHETFIPILEILSDGKIFHHSDLLNKVLQKYYSDLPVELLNEKTKSGEKLILNRIAWGKSYLKKVGYIIYPERGFVQITKPNALIKFISQNLVKSIFFYINLLQGKLTRKNLKNLEFY